jgi:hypothetical protein
MNKSISLLYLLFFAFSITICGCEGNSIVVDTNKKIVTDKHGEGFVSFTINGDMEFIQYILQQSCYKNTPGIYLLKENPCYDITVITKSGIDHPIHFVFKPRPGEKYKLENSSNGDAHGAVCEVMFDSLYNLNVIYPDSSKITSTK